MASLLWTHSFEATERIEAYWDDLIGEHSISLLCAYALNGAAQDLPASLLSCHSHHLLGDGLISNGTAA
jgi:hypothetical protein